MYVFLLCEIVTEFCMSFLVLWPYKYSDNSIGDNEKWIGLESMNMTRKDVQVPIDMVQFT